MIKVFNKGKAVINIGDLSIKPLEERVIKDHEINKINRANSLAKLGLVKITPYERVQEVIPAVEEELPKTKTKKKSK